MDGRGLLELQGRDGPLGVECLLAITCRMLQDNQDFLCIFDAVSGVMFDRSRQPAMAELYRRLLRRYPDRFGEVPDRQSAEQIMLDIARTFQPRIVCNRLFNTHVLQDSKSEQQRRQRFSPVRVEETARSLPPGAMWQGDWIQLPASTPAELLALAEQYERLLKKSKAQLFD